MRSRKISDDSGSLLIEALVALAIFTIVFTAFISLSMARAANSQDLERRREAMFSALREIYDSTSTIKYISPCIMNLTASSSWNSFGINKNVSFSATSTDLDYAKKISGDCGGTNFPSSFPQNPPTNFYVTSGQISSIDTLGTNIYLSDNESSSSSVLAYDTSRNQSEVKIDSQINAIDAIHGKIFLAVNGTSRQFRVIDSSDLNKMFESASSSLPGVSGSYPGATCIAYFNSKVYVGTHRTAGNELHIFDVSSNSPVWLGSIELNHNINAIAIKEPYAFLATSGNTDNLIIVDISRPNTIKKISSLAFTGTEDSLSIFLSGNKLYLGRKKGTSASHPDILIIDISDPTKPLVAGTFYLHKDVIGIKVFNDIIYAATNDPQSALTILNGNDPLKIAPIMTITSIHSGHAMDTKDNEILVGTDNGLDELIFPIK